MFNGGRKPVGCSRASTERVTGDEVGEVGMEDDHIRLYSTPLTPRADIFLLYYPKEIRKKSEIYASRNGYYSYI